MHFETKGTVLEARGFTSKHEDLIRLDSKLHIHQARPHPRAVAMATTCCLDFVDQ